MSSRQRPLGRGLGITVPCVLCASWCVCVRAWGTRGQRVLVFCVCFLWDKPGREDPSVSVVWMGPRAHPWGTSVIVLSGVATWLPRHMPCHATAADNPETLPLVLWIPVPASWHGLAQLPQCTNVWITSITGGVGTQRTVRVSGVGRLADWMAGSGSEPPAAAGDGEDLADPGEEHAWVLSSLLLAVNGSGPPGRRTCTFYVNHLKHSHKTLSNAYVTLPEQSVPDTGCLC